MKTILFTFLLFSGAVSAQTTLIAHKSHSGTAASYAFADPGNFGAPSRSIIAVKKLNDTSVVVKYDRWGGNLEDTVFNHPLYSDPNISEDTMKVMMKQMDIEYTVPTAEEKKAIEEEMKSKQAPQPERKVNKAKSGRSSKKHSFLWLIILGGGTFLGGMLITAQKRNIKPSLISQV